MSLLSCLCISTRTKGHGIPCIIRMQLNFNSKSRLDKYPSLNFLVIINPDNGPGNDTLLDPNFQRELPQLMKRKNVIPIGYVRTINATRSLEDVARDVDSYALWMDNNTSNYLVHGIFFDETPSIYTKESSELMSSIDNYVKNHRGFDNTLVYPIFGFTNIDCAQSRNGAQ